MTLGNSPEPDRTQDAYPQASDSRLRRIKHWPTRSTTLVVLAVAAIAGCASSAPSPYATGSAFAVAEGKAEGGARLIGVSPMSWCQSVANSGNQSMPGSGVAINAPAGGNALR
jgi:hypothetical protein